MDSTIAWIDKKFSDQYGTTASEKMLLAYLLAATRNGYLHVQIDSGVLNPSFEELFGSLEGAEEIKAVDQLSPSLPVVREGNCFYLKRIALSRENVWAEIKRLSQSTKGLSKTAPVLSERLTEEQKQAVLLSLQFPFFILTGGPGTGKTFTAAQILNAYLSSCSISSPKIALAAPTGKAALHLEKTLSETLKRSFESVTLHRLARARENVLPYDFYLVDEASMIDLELMEKWLKKVKSGARVVLLGDPFQLPPVECGSLFAELCAIYPGKTSLTKCLRAESVELVSCAASLLKEGRFVPSEVVSLYSKEEALHPFLEGHLAAFPVDASLSIQTLIDQFNSFRILSPLRKGPIGIDAINQFILKKLYASKKSELFPLPIMISANAPDLKLFNGETGLMLTTHAPTEPLTPEDRVYFPDGRSIPALLLPSFEFAYAITVHKSQGSEFDHVALLLGDDPLSRKKELLYTAATRAKKKLSVWGI
ncbi:MAG: ATP-dependent RecD-like DNA helicase [Parachlamydiaceae bacterium]